jgi:alkylhydroperoxidase family enzyme
MAAPVLPLPTPSPRIDPIEPPYPPDVAASLAKMMGHRTDREPLRLFRTLAQHFALGDRIRPLGSALLTHGLLDPRERELVILRTCARAGCEYEWGVHVSLFARPLGLSDALIQATVSAAPDDAVFSPGEALLIRLADELHDTAMVSDGLWARLAERWEARQLLELLMLAGWYHLIAFGASGARVVREDWAERFPVRNTDALPELLRAAESN